MSIACIVFHTLLLDAYNEPYVLMKLQLTDYMYHVWPDAPNWLCPTQCRDGGVDCTAQVNSFLNTIPSDWLKRANWFLMFCNCTLHQIGETRPCWYRRSPNTEASVLAASAIEARSLYQWSLMSHPSLFRAQSGTLLGGLSRSNLYMWVGDREGGVLKSTWVAP